jgi:hypothetical protein
LATVVDHSCRPQLLAKVDLHSCWSNLLARVTGLVASSYLPAIANGHSTTFDGLSCWATVAGWLMNIVDGHSCRLKLTATVKGHCCWPRLLVTDVGHSCRQKLTATIGGHCCWPKLSATLLVAIDGVSCGPKMPVAIAGLSCWSQLPTTVAGHNCWQCCGSGSGIRCLVDPWIWDPK